MTPCMGENDINAPRRLLGATACSMAIAALVPFPAFFEGPQVCLGGGGGGGIRDHDGAREEWASAQALK
jgi:hypothetical protein